MDPNEGSGVHPNPPVECPASDELARGISVLVESMGGRVRIDPNGENLCRQARPDELGAIHVIEAQGLPNLVHELVHALFWGRLADDHGFDYGLIPLDLADPHQRRHLWEELACCVVSAAYAERYQPAGFRLAWFREQFEIQGVFHGLEGDLAGFRDHVDRAVSRADWRLELEATLDFAFRETRDRLHASGTPAELADLNDVIEFESLWREYRRLWDVSETPAEAAGSQAGVR